MDPEVRRSIVQIRFIWMENKKNYEVMVIPGVIISIDDGKATIIANSTFFKKGLPYFIHFPNADSYEEVGFKPPVDLVVRGRNFFTLTVPTNGAGYIKPVKFEEQPISVGDQINAFVFPRETYITQATYLRGFILTTCGRIFIHDCKLHEYGYLGSPQFNRRGHLVGITYLDKGHLQAWSVLELRKGILKNRNCAFVFEGEPKGAPPTAEA